MPNKRLRFPWGRYSVFGIKNQAIPRAAPVMITTRQILRIVLPEIQRKKPPKPLATILPTDPSPNRFEREKNPLMGTSSSLTTANALGTDRILAESEGITVIDTARLRATAQLTATAISLNSCPASSRTKITGRNTAIVVSVLATRAPKTSTTPRYAPLWASSPIWRWR